MKNLLPILFLPFLLVSCYEEIIIPVGDDEPVAVMNAQFNTAEATHEIMLSVSHENQVKALDGADVRVTVNGKKTFQATEVNEVTDAWAIRRHTVYRFDAEIKPGDEVLVEARKDAFHLTSTVTAPPVVTLSSIDTSTVRMSFMGDTSDYLQVKVSFQDLPGLSWYRVAACMESDFAYLDEEGNPVPEWSGEYIWWLSPETGYDPIISEGNGKTSGMDLGALLSAENSYNCFSDNPFQDKECTIRPLFYPYIIYTYYDRYMVPDDFNYETGWDILKGMPFWIHRKVRLQVRSIDFAQYHYLKALQNLDTFGTEVTFLVEPTTLPSNVEGGLGFVGLETVSEVVFHESEETLPAMNDITYY